MYSDHQKQLARDLWEAVKTNNVSEVMSLLEQGADPNHPVYWSDEWRKNSPPLHKACYNGYYEIVMMLVDRGACTDIGDSGSFNRLPLHCACKGGHKVVVKYLIQKVKCNTGK